MNALVKSAARAGLAAAVLAPALVPALTQTAGAATLTVTNATPSEACLAAATWEVALLCLPPQSGSDLPCTYQPLPQWHGSGWSCLAPGAVRSFDFASSLIVGVQIGGQGGYVEAHPLTGYGSTDQVWVAPGPFESRIAPMAGGAYVATVSLAGGPWQTRRALSREQLVSELGQLGFNPVAAWRFDRNFAVRLSSP